MPKFTKLWHTVEQPSVLNEFFSELQYSAAFGRESRKFAGGSDISVTETITETEIIDPVLTETETETMLIYETEIL